MAYGLSVACITLLFFRPGASVNPAVPGLVALCVGDGLAEVFGVTFGKYSPRWPWSSRKTLVGSLGGFITAVPAAAALLAMVGTSSDRHVTGSSLLIVMLVAMLVESFDVWGEFDNAAVAFSATLTAMLVIPNVTPM